MSLISLYIHGDKSSLCCVGIEKGQVKSNREEHEEVMKKHDDSSKRQPPRGSVFVQPPPLSITGLAGLLSPIVELIK